MELSIVIWYIVGHLLSLDWHNYITNYSIVATDYMLCAPLIIRTSIIQTVEMTALLDYFV